MTTKDPFDYDLQQSRILDREAHRESLYAGRKVDAFGFAERHQAIEPSEGAADFFDDLEGTDECHKSA